MKKVDEALMKARDELRSMEDLSKSVTSRVHQNEMEMKQLEIAKARMIRKSVHSLSFETFLVQCLLTFRSSDTEMARMQETYQQLEATLVTFSSRLASLICAEEPESTSVASSK